MNTTFSTPNSRFRSVKYKTNHANSATTATLKFKETYTRPSHSSLTQHNKNNLLKTLNKYSPYIQMENQEDYQLPKKSIGQLSYLELVDIAINSEDKTKIKSIEKSALQFKQFKDQQVKNRVHLPVLADYYSEHCTLLDPIRLPIQHIEDSIYQLNNQIKKESIQVKMIRCTIPGFQQNELRKLEQIEKEGIENMKKISQILKSYRVLQQQHVLNMKTSIEELNNFIPPFKKKVQQNHKKVMDLQSTIFSCNPFQLQQKQQFHSFQNSLF